MLGQARYGVDDHLTLRLTFGPTLLNASVDYRVGINLRDLGEVTTSTGPIHGIAGSLTAGVSYRLGS